MSDTPHTELTRYIKAVMKADDEMCLAIEMCPPRANGRYDVAKMLEPPKMDIRAVMTEARRNGELSILAPKIESLHTAIMAYWYAFIDFDQGHFVPNEAWAVSDAIESLVPYVPSGEADDVVVKHAVKKKLGRPSDTDHKQDAKWASAWGSGQHASKAECASSLHTTERKLQLALDRDRKRK